MTTPLKKIDPIKVREAGERMYKRKRAIEKAEKAARALKWLAEHTDGREPAYQGFRLAALASDHLADFPHAPHAMEYLTQAAREAQSSIVRSAIETALADLAEGEKP